MIEFPGMMVGPNLMGGGLFPQMGGLGMPSMAMARLGMMEPGMGMMDPSMGMGMGGMMPGMGMMGGGLGNTQFLMQMVEMLTMMLLGNVLQQAMGGAQNASNSGGSCSGGGGGGGGDSSGAGDSSGSSSVPTGDAGSDPVALGRQFLGQNSIDIKGKLSNFTAAGGQTNDCADFVCSLLQSTGKLKGHFVGVSALEGALKQQGWHQVPASQARPGDVWISNSRSHTEMVTQAGGTKCIGSNNDRPGHQVISEKPMNPSSGVYYTKG